MQAQLLFVSANQRNDKYVFFICLDFRCLYILILSCELGLGTEKILRYGQEKKNRNVDVINLKCIRNGDWARNET